MSKTTELVIRFLESRAAARDAVIASLTPWRDGRGYWHMPPFPLRAWLAWGACQMVLFLVACAAITPLYFLLRLVRIGLGIEEP